MKKEYLIYGGLAIGLLLFFLLYKNKKMFKDYLNVIFNNEFTAKDPAKITSDSGGLTKYGISDKADGIIDEKYFGEDIRSMQIERATEIYFNEYFSKLANEFVNFPNVALEIFDLSVNRGVGTALNTVYRALNTNSKSGIFEYINKFGDVNTVSKIKEQRILDYKELAKNPKFAPYLNGWLNRVKNTKF